MEILGGFMVMISIIGLFLAVVWLIMPFVVFAIKGKQDRTLEILEALEKRLAVIENTLVAVHTDPTGRVGSSHSSLQERQMEPAENRSEHVAGKTCPEVSSVL